MIMSTKLWIKNALYVVDEEVQEAYDDALVEIDTFKAELEMIDDHLFQYVDTQTTRDFIKTKTPSAKRLLRLCDLIDAARAGKKKGGD